MPATRYVPPEPVEDGMRRLFRPVAEYLPVAGQVMAARDAMSAVRSGNYGDAAVAAAGLVPGMKQAQGVRRLIDWKGWHTRKPVNREVMDEQAAELAARFPKPPPTPEELMQQESIAQGARMGREIGDAILEKYPWLALLDAGLRGRRGAVPAEHAMFLQNYFKEDELTRRQNEDMRRAMKAGLEY